MINRLVRNFTFDDKIRSGLVFSDASKIRLNTENKASPKLQLKLQGSAGYSTDDDIYVETPLVTPNVLNKWLSFETRFFESYGEHVLPTGTSLGFKIKTTADNYYWDGANWSIAGLSDWSTESEIRTNIETFPIQTIGNKSIGIVINLKTTDTKVTPEVKEVKILGEFDIEYYEDLIYDTLIRKINLEFRSTSVVVFPTYSNITSVDLNDILENKGYNITGISKVINLIDDPLKLDNVFDSYVPGPLNQDGFTYGYGTVNFSSSISSGKLVEITFYHIPEIIIKTGQDYFEVVKYPSIVFTRINETSRKGFIMQDTNSYGVDYVKNRDSNTAVMQYAPTQKSYRFEYNVFTNNQTDQLRLMKDFNRFLGLNKQLTSWGLGCKYDVDIVKELDTIGNSKENDSSDTNLASGSFDILGVVFYDKPSEDLYLVQRVNTEIEIE